jgi:eukaryotic-like serine/threonine-protein kinase
MGLVAGTLLGNFEVLGPLGAGGMGEVYRARDRKLGREVAIKVLPSRLASDAAGLARFDREARLLAALNHPGIASIYGAEQSSGVDYLVLELVPGETLRDLVHRGPLPLEDALDVARQIADALAAAHERGIVHRDLKPSNVKITPTGKVKILDFGLAKVAAAIASDPGATESPTVDSDATLPGVVLGTPEYMSPEQARGRAVDRRADLWSFGCMLFEMLSGTRPFRGGSRAEILVAVLAAEPDWTALPATTPARIRDLLERCLEKDPERRLRDAGDARLEIERELPAAVSGSHAHSRPTVTLSRRSPLLGIVGGVAAALVVALALGLLLRSASHRPRAGASPAGSEPEPRSIVVLPSRDLSGVPDGQLVGDGMA